MTSLTCQTSPLPNDDREITLKTSDQTSSIESEIDSSPSPKSSHSDVSLSPSSQYPESAEDGHQWQSIGCGGLNVQHLSNQATSSCGVNIEPPGDWNLHNDSSQVQSIETERK